MPSTYELSNLVQAAVRTLKQVELAAKAVRIEACSKIIDRPGLMAAHDMAVCLLKEP